MKEIDSTDVRGQKIYILISAFGSWHRTPKTLDFEILTSGLCLIPDPDPKA